MDLNSFKANFRYGGARTSLFRLTITNPIVADSDLQFPWLAKASALPESTLQTLEVAHFGRTVKLPGRKTYSDWNVTIYNDEDFRIRNALESWSNAINSPETNRRLLGSSDISLYKSTGLVEQLSQTGNVIRTYKMVGIFPSSVASIGLDWDGESVQQFDTTFSYDYFVVEPGPTGNAFGI
jgi:hypothetical protein